MCDCIAIYYWFYPRQHNYRSLNNKRTKYVPIGTYRAGSTLIESNQSLAYHTMIPKDSNIENYMEHNSVSFCIIEEIEPNKLEIMKESQIIQLLLSADSTFYMSYEGTINHVKNAEFCTVDVDDIQFTPRSLRNKKSQKIERN